jgi:hypothetical protein
MKVTLKRAGAGVPVGIAVGVGVAVAVEVGVGFPVGVGFAVGSGIGVWLGELIVMLSPRSVTVMFLPFTLRVSVELAKVMFSTAWLLV